MVINDNFDISLLITFHREGIFAHSTLNSIERCRKFAERTGISTECIWVLDSVDDETRNVLLAHPAKSDHVRIIESSYRDLGASRNLGIAAAHGTAIAILDGDDYFSTNWIERAWHYLREYGPQSILHPEVVVNFGTHSAYCWQIDQITHRHYDRAGLLIGNYWTSWTFALRTVYIQCPYVTTHPLETGFGYEDWHWNCETIACGYQHRIVPGTIGFYRRKKTASLVEFTSQIGAIIPPTRLFSRESVMETKK